ncbi:MAG: protein-tyrosine-phosphatase [Wenyingzhuangia sp.]|jgi:arsenate reductase (thioredoxin)|uniref:protein-tyrosine-phosphatase n=1 Tax=Wenyingzhuangia sp. TaxID=1964193 RepID=UPI00321B5E15
MNTKSNVLDKIEQTIVDLKPLNISLDRKKVLLPLVKYIQTKVNSKEEIHLNFICTHNSRRSHFSQIWAQIASFYFNIQNVFCYSGGTEETALYPKVIETLENSGLQIDKITDNHNPVYNIKYAESEHPIIGYSKKYNDTLNPKKMFAAIMTCEQADKGCPIVVGAEKRIPLTFEDPKVFDHTSQQTEKYNERNLQIATEMIYIFSQIKS